MVVPKQLSKKFDIEVIESLVKTASGAMLSLMILQIILQMVLNYSIEHILSFLYTLQYLSYIVNFNLQLPGFVDIFLQEIIKLIEFQSLNVDSLVGIWDPEFKLVDWIRGYRERIVSEQQNISIV